MITSEMRLFTVSETTGEADRSSFASSSLLVVETRKEKKQTDVENQGTEEDESKIYRQLIRVRRCRMFFVDVIFDIDIVVIVIINVLVVLVFVVAVLRCRR